MHPISHRVRSRDLWRGRHPDGPRLSLLLLACLLITLLSSTAIAQDSVSEVTVITSNNAYPAPPPGYTRIDIDLNQGAGGDFIYVCYKKGVGAPVTGLAVTVNSGQPPTDSVYTRINVDLNRDAGGAFIWLWYTKDPDCGTVHDIQVQNHGGAVPDGYTSTGVDLNYSVGGAYILLSYLKQ